LYALVPKDFLRIRKKCMRLLIASLSRHFTLPLTLTSLSLRERISAAAAITDKMSGAGAANESGGGEPARKRIRLESAAGGVLSTTAPTITNGNTLEHCELAEMVRAKIAEVTTKASHSREREVGILKWVNEKNTGFEGVLKQRYVRFMLISV
jgi:hypothetical protein